jgi:hypothetical protein
MTEETEFRWMRAWLGAFLAGLVVFLIFFVQGIGQVAGIPTFVLGVILLLLMAGWAMWAWRKGDREMATGVAVGYGVLTLISGGQCTLFVENGFEGAFSAGTGFAVYPLLLIAALIAFGIASVVRRRRQAGEEKHE